jgi:hypothetical protein
MSDRSDPTVVESYRGYSPALDVRTLTESLPGDVPPRLLAGLHEVLLTNSGGLSHDRRRARTWSRGRKVHVADVRGLYHQAWHGHPAWIEIFVDRIFQDVPGWVLRVPPIRDVLLGEVLYHEIGHHAHHTVEREYREREAVAEDWARHLVRARIRRRYPWLYHPVNILMRLARTLAAAARWAGRRFGGAPRRHR